MLGDLDKRWPKCGPCAMCGGPDKRHRLWDAIETSGRLDGVAFAARDYDVSRADVRLLMRAFSLARYRHARLPGRYPLVSA